MSMSDRLAILPEAAIALLKEKFGEAIKIDWPLHSYSTFGTGGRAGLFMEVETPDQLSLLLHTVRELNIPHFMLGGGSNILISDKGYRGLIIRNLIKGLKVEGATISSGAGESLNDLVSFAAECGLTGLEFATGIWGTVGGAIYGNAGAYGAEIGTCLDSAQVIDKQGNMRTETASYFEFSYRISKLKSTGEFIASAKFALKKGDKALILSRINEIMETRKAKLPLDKRSAGCFFKNVVDKNRPYGKIPAGQLLEEIGAKEITVGGARVSEEHANILINEGTATSEEIWRLAEILKRHVKDKFGIVLQEEIVFLGEFQEESL